MRISHYFVILFHAFNRKGKGIWGDSRKYRLYIIAEILLDQ